VPFVSEFANTKFQSDASIDLAPTVKMRPSTNGVRGGNVGSICAAELAKAPFLLYPERSNMGMTIDRFFKEIDVTPRVAVEADDTEATKRLVEPGFGHAILPEHALRRHAGFFHKFRAKNIALREHSPLRPRRPTSSANSRMP
jgi:DNA-binding transcriptional LysR family regulator